VRPTTDIDHEKDVRMVTPKQTRYAGCNFRSRLEARWAVFMDALEIGWEYESEGFDLDENEGYLPDFWLERNKVWLEVKGPPPDDLNSAKFLKFASKVAGKDERCRWLGPIPRTALDTIEVTGGLDPTARKKGRGMLGAVPCYVASTSFIPVWGEGVGDLVTRHEDGHFSHHISVLDGIDLEYWILQPAVWTPAPWSVVDVQGALDAARSARFEFGESGAT
jgi:hypothetical protein